MSMARKGPRTGVLILCVAVGSGGLGYMLGAETGGAPEAVRPPRADTRPLVVLEPPPTLPPAWEDLPAEDGEGGAEAAPEIVSVEGMSTAELLRSLQEHAGTERGQMMLLGMVADAARRGPAALPELRELLESGVDIQFPGYTGKGLGYPSLRVALLAAAEATGDPEAARIIADVAHSSESPVEVVYSAHLLDRLDALDPQTAQRTLDALAKPLTAEQKKAMGAVAGRVLPAVAAVDPAYAENFLALQLRMPKGTGTDPRFAAAVLDGLPADQARSLVLNTLSAADVSERNKQLLAARASQRQELSMLTELRQGIESNAFTPKIAGAIANSALGGSSYRVMQYETRRAIKQGNLEEARGYAALYHERLVEVQRTIEAARNAGARVRPDVMAQLQLSQRRLDMLRAQISSALKKQTKAQ